MPRTSADINLPSEEKWPPPGRHLLMCINSAIWKSPKKKTPAVMLTWADAELVYEFGDPVFVTPAALARLNLVAQRVCHIPNDMPLPDDDAGVAKVLAHYILENAIGNSAYVTVEENIEKFMYTTGPKAGQTGEKARRKVAFAGYEFVDKPVDKPTQSPVSGLDDGSADEIPF